MNVSRPEIGVFSRKSFNIKLDFAHQVDSEKLCIALYMRIAQLAESDLSIRSK